MSANLVSFGFPKRRSHIYRPASALASSFSGLIRLIQAIPTGIAWRRGASQNTTRPRTPSMTTTRAGEIWLTEVELTRHQSASEKT